MANPLIKQNEHGYGYGQGYGYGEHVPLLPSGKRNLAIALAIIFLGIAWLCFRFLVWQEVRQLNAANISWERGEVEDAWEHLESVGLWAVEFEHFQTTRLTQLLERNPTAALNYAKLAVANESGIEYKKPDFPWEALLLAAIRSQNWDALAGGLRDVKTSGTLNEDSPVSLTAQAWLALSMSQAEKAWELLQTALERNPYDTEALLLRSELQARSGNRLDRNQALVSLREIIKEAGPDSVRASLLLITSGLIPDLQKDWDSELESLAKNPYLETHYLFARPSALRATLSRVRGKNPELSYRFAKQLSELNIANSEEIAEYAFNAQEIGEQHEAKNAITRYDDQVPNGALGAWLHTRQSWFEEDLISALEGCRKGLNTPQVQRFLPLLAVFSQQQKIPVPEDLQAEAMSLILGYKSLSAEQWDFAARKLWVLSPEREKELIEQARHWSESNPILATRFLLDHNHPVEALEALDKLPPPSPNEAIELRFRALVQGGSYTEATTLLDESSSITSFTRLSGKLMLALLSKDPPQIEETWQNAWALAEQVRSPAVFAALGDLSFEYNSPKLALEAYQKAKALAPALPIASESLQRYASLELKEKRTSEALDLIKQALFAEPKSTELQRQWAYYSLLLNTNLLEAKDTIRVLFNRPEHDSSVTITMAFAYLRTGQKARALALLKQNNGMRIKSDADQAILYAALTAAGEDKRAEELREQINEEQLLPEELALIEEFQPVIIEEIEIQNIPEDIRLIDLQKARESEG